MCFFTCYSLAIGWYWIFNPCRLTTETLAFKLCKTHMEETCLLRTYLCNMSIFFCNCKFHMGEDFYILIHRHHHHQNLVSIISSKILLHPYPFSRKPKLTISKKKFDYFHLYRSILYTKITSNRRNMKSTECINTHTVPWVPWMQGWHLFTFRLPSARMSLWVTHTPHRTLHCFKANDKTKKKIRQGIKHFCMGPLALEDNQNRWTIKIILHLLLQSLLIST